ncbi:MAG: RimK family protein [Bacteroidetes bacterium]|nr:RimK family protein [Bacteroidota bacterium]
MLPLIVVNNPADWNLSLENVRVVSARQYLTEVAAEYPEKVRVYNLCRSYRYQSAGYYVSLLAEARGHKPIPGIATIEDMKSQHMVRFVSDDLDELIQSSLAPIKSEAFTLSIYFGRNLAKRYDRLCSYLHASFPVPFARAQFTLTQGKWVLRHFAPIPASEIPQEHKPFVVDVMRGYFAGKKPSVPKKTALRYDMAILWNPDEADAPSDERALQKFIKAAESLGMGCERITRHDYGRLAEFDALFIRETTNVNHHTYRFARRAQAEGLVVMDDPDSILKCTNKVYLAELLARHRIRGPKTVIIHRDNLGDVELHLGFPCVLKQPDGAFSTGVIKVADSRELTEKATAMLEKSDLVIAQEFVKTDFDWRIGIIDQKPLYACKYFMARKHWQIIKRDQAGKTSFGISETVPVELVPKQVIKTALKIANLMGNGLYGVDLKQIGNECVVIEVNDNPSIDSGLEDALLKDELYKRIMEVFLKRIEEKKAGR